MSETPSVVLDTERWTSGRCCCSLGLRGGGATGSPLPQDIEATSISDVPGCAASGM